MLESARWTGIAGETYAVSLLASGQFVYTGLLASVAIPYAQVVKINRKTMATATKWSSATLGLGQDVYAILYDGTNLFAGYNSRPILALISTVDKINISTMATVSQWIGNGNQLGVGGIAHDGTNLYISHKSTALTKATRVDKATMTTQARLDVASSDMYYGVVYLNGRLYVGVFGNSLWGLAGYQVSELDPVTLAILNNVSYQAQGITGGLALITDGSFLYAGFGTWPTPGSPGRVVKIDPNTLGVAGGWTGAAGQNFVLGLCNGPTGYIYAGLATTPGKVVLINTTTMATEEVWTASAGNSWCMGVAYSGGIPYTSLLNSPAAVVRLAPLPSGYLGNILIDQLKYQHTERMKI